MPLDSLEVGTLEWSENNFSSLSELLVSLDRKNVSSPLPESDGVGSSIEDEPLPLVIWVVVLDEGSVLRRTNVLVASVERSSSMHVQSNLELNARVQWESWVLDSSAVSPPGLVLTVMAFVPDQVSIVSVGATVDIEASVADISDVSHRSSEPSDLLEWLVSEWSRNGSIVPVSPVVSTLLDGHSKSSVTLWSDSSGSPVKDPPLLNVSWVVVLDSESVLMASDVLSIDNSSVVSHSRSNLELLTATEWVSWEVNALSGDEPSLVGTVVASPEDNVSVVVVVTSMDIKAVTTRVSEVSVGTTEVVESLSSIVVLILSHYNSSVVSHELTSLVRDGI